MIVKPLDSATAKRIISAKHYSKRLGIFWAGFGLYDEEKIVGVCCYGQPSPPIQRSAFKDRDFRLFELTRLVVDRGIVNGPSFLISHSLRMLEPKPCAVISYSDSAQGHAGIVYQATNWLYTGAVTAHDSFYKVGDEILHPITVRDRYNISNPKEWAKVNGIEIVKPKPKHRYFYFLGNKKEKKSMIDKLAYKIIPTYPKADKSMYEDGAPCSEI